MNLDRQHLVTWTIQVIQGNFIILVNVQCTSGSRPGSCMESLWGLSRQQAIKVGVSLHANIPTMVRRSHAEEIMAHNEHKSNIHNTTHNHVITTSKPPHIHMPKYPHISTSICQYIHISTHPHIHTCKLSTHTHMQTSYNPYTGYPYDNATQAKPYLKGQIEGDRAGNRLHHLCKCSSSGSGGPQLTATSRSLKLQLYKRHKTHCKHFKKVQLKHTC